MPVKMAAALKEISDTVRARELYKYFQPDSPFKSSINTPDRQRDSDTESFTELQVRANVSSSKISSPDTALTAFSQLVSWRTGTQRAMISVIDVDTQHFIAESTKTLDLLDNSRHEAGDGLWMGCSRVSKAGRLCERTIALPPAATGEYATFIISDLREDGRFNQLPFVTGPPFIKFYAGTPLITKRGIPIGSLFVVDDRARAGLTREEICFMGTMAGTIMQHLEVLRQVEEHRRGMKMSRGLASFVEGRTGLFAADGDALANEEGGMVAGQFEIGSEKPNIKSNTTWNATAESPNGSKINIELKEKEYSNAILKTEEAIMAVSQTGGVKGNLQHGSSGSRLVSDENTTLRVPLPQADTSSKNTTEPAAIETSEASALKMLFSRAANLIREAFEVDGGSVFYDAQRGFTSEYSPETAAQNSPGMEDDDSRSSSDSAQIEVRDFVKEHEDARSSGSGMFPQTSMGLDKNVEILGFSTPTASSVHGDEYPGSHSFLQFDETVLHSFLRRYPRGKLWSFDQDVYISSSDEDIVVKGQEVPNTSGRAKKNTARCAAEAAILLKHFPGVSQLLFVPLWDASRSRWLSGNFTWSTEPTRVLSKENELAFLTAFGNSVMAECSRLDTEIADQKKGDFIGSVSHELRSPLHGILASAEFLGEEVTGPFAKGLVETIDSCGRTLLDTINHILDFSKINHLEKNWRRSRRAGSSISRPAARNDNSFSLRKADLPMINLFADVDISILCEEVVEGVFAGHVFQNVTAPSFDSVADSRGKMSDNRQDVSSSGPIIDTEHPSNCEVAVILDIDIHNYHFTTQPGAVRRVIMNLLGNSLKYTSRGYVKIQLATGDMEDLHPVGTTESIPRASVTLTVTDTGKGISSDFIRSKLFTPFAQENSLSSGTGLGLSIVRSIVALLEGEIAIKSEVGLGTEVKVTLPLLRELPKGGDSSGSTPKSVSSVPKESEEVVNQLRRRVIGKSVSVLGLNNDSENPLDSQTSQLLKASITNFLSNWYGMKMVSAGEKADIILVNEPTLADITNLARLRRSNRRGPAVLALCSHSSRFDRSYANTNANADIGFLAKPIGPLKLARAISQCLDGIPVNTTPRLERGIAAASGAAVDGTDLTNVFEGLSLSPNGGEVLDNSRMAADSDNARKAIESPTPTGSNEKQQEFPFPNSSARSTTATAKNLSAEREILKHTKPGPTSNPPDVHKKADSKVSVTSTSTDGPVSSPALQAPRLLLVDDNKINLRLLRTYMRKRNYNCVDEAENGVEAVSAVHSRNEGYDIIFMDISMPVLDGFGATRQIRQIERARREKYVTDGAKPPSPALVIALTGLASSRDQSEAFTSGVDLFLTKPVSFKEVGKMLDNWQANRERETKSTGEILGGMDGTSRVVDAT